MREQWWLLQHLHPCQLAFFPTNDFSGKIWRNQINQISVQYPKKTIKQDEYTVIDYSQIKPCIYEIPYDAILHWRICFVMYCSVLRCLIYYATLQFWTKPQVVAMVTWKDSMWLQNAKLANIT